MSSDSITVFRGDTTDLKNTVPIAERVTTTFYEREREFIFHKAWLPVASLSDLPSPGSYVVVDMPTHNTSLLIVRGEDSKIRSFHNVCRHRGDKLVRHGQGCRLRFTCGFHGWRYSSTGELLTITDETQFKGVDRTKLGLLQVHTGVWHDLIFVNFASTPSESLESWLGSIWTQYGGVADGAEKISEHRVILRTNWNLAVNAFCEGYHNMFIHRHTVPDYQGSTTNKMRHRAYIEVGRNFGRYSAHGNVNHKPTPAEDALYRHGRKLFPWFPVVDPKDLPPGVNPSGFNEWAFDIVHLFPNCIFSPQANAHLYMWFWPIDADHTELRAVNYFREAKKPGEQLGQAYAKVRMREVLREDLATMEAAHGMISSGYLPYIVLSQQELLIQNHYAMADRMLMQGQEGRRSPSQASTETRVVGESAFAQ